MPKPDCSSLSDCPRGLSGQQQSVRPVYPDAPYPIHVLLEARKANHCHKPAIQCFASAFSDIGSNVDTPWNEMPNRAHADLDDAECHKWKGRGCVLPADSLGELLKTTRACVQY